MSALTHCHPKLAHDIAYDLKDLFFSGDLDDGKTIRVRAHIRGRGDAVQLKNYAVASSAAS